MKNYKAFTLVAALIWIGIIATVLSVVIPLLTNGLSISDGARVGNITKFSRKGLINKSYEGEMNLGGLKAGQNNNIQANIWQFTVTDPAVIDQINKAVDADKRVKLNYHQTVGHNPLTRDTSYTVTKVEVLD
jgi:hypothetical protein